jgi:hypothetical protein
MTLLKIDIDFKPPKEWMQYWIETREKMLRDFGFTPEYVKVFETTRGIHVYIKIKEDVSAKTTNMLQFLCGDDPTRVKINMWRIERGIPYWNKLFHRVLYRKKQKVIECYYCGNKIPISSD